MGMDSFKIEKLDILAYLILLEQQKDVLQIEWNRFEYAIKNKKTRNTTYFVDVLNNIRRTYMLSKGHVLYRARTINKTGAMAFIEAFRDIANKHSIPLDETLGCFSGNNSVLHLCHSKEYIKDDNVKSVLSRAIQAYKNEAFVVYGKDGLCAPPGNACKSNRASAEGVRYLYASEDAETPLYEVRANVEQAVCLATLVAKRDLTLFNLTDELPNRQIRHIDDLNVEFSFLSNNFSYPIYEEEYKTTQYIAKTIRQMGFDGIRYNSAVHPSGKNIVLFDPDACDVVSSELMEITDITVSSKSVKDKYLPKD